MLYEKCPLLVWTGCFCALKWMNNFNHIPVHKPELIVVHCKIRLPLFSIDVRLKFADDLFSVRPFRLVLLMLLFPLVLNAFGVCCLNPNDLPEK